MIKKILKKALEDKASDIILSPNKKVCYKINWSMIFQEDFWVLSKEIMNSIFLQISNKTQQDIFNKNKELDFWLALWKIRFRVNVFWVKDWFWLVFRIIPAVIPDFSDLWLPDIIKSFINKKNGIVLITWAVGSWKSTTLASLLNIINNNQSKHIITIEDPIEFVYADWKSLVEQREVWVNTLSFDNWLKYALRQAPDIVMIWEMRDLETFRLALRAAETWNLVFATLHTSWAARTVARIIDMFPAWEKDQIRSQLSESLIWVVWQKLLSTKDWKWRVAATEVLLNNVWISNVIRKWETHKLDSIIETSKGEWMIQMKDSLKELFDKWLISQEEYNLELSYLK